MFYAISFPTGRGAPFPPFPLKATLSFVFHLFFLGLEPSGVLFGSLSLDFAVPLVPFYWTSAKPPQIPWADLQSTGGPLPLMEASQWGVVTSLKCQNSESSAGNHHPLGLFPPGCLGPFVFLYFRRIGGAGAVWRWVFDLLPFFSESCLDHDLSLPAQELPPFFPF